MTSGRFLLGAVLAASALAACEAGAPDEAVVPAEPPAGPAPLPAQAAEVPEGATRQEQAALVDPDCRVVAEAYLGALERGAYAVAAEFWDDPVIDGERLAALFAAYRTPRVEIADIQEDGGSGSLYCTITGALSDSSDPRVALRQGQLVLRRVNDVSGAEEEQLPWTLRSSSFIEPMERSGRGGPA